MNTSKIKLSLWQLFVYKICTSCLIKKPWIKLLNKGAMLIKEKLDIVYIIRLIINHNRLKEMIFTNEQNILIIWYISLN